jgi:hypothetical protein
VFIISKSNETSMMQILLPVTATVANFKSSFTNFFIHMFMLKTEGVVKPFGQINLIEEF